MLRILLLIISAIMVIVEIGITIIVTPFLVIFMLCIIIIEGAIRRN
jgi:hypothetical protein